MSTEISIIKIKEDEYVFKNEDIEMFDVKNLLVKYSVKFEWNLEKEEFYIRMTVWYNYKSKDKEIDLVKFSITTGFLVKGLKEILKIEDGKFQLSDSLMMTFLSTTISSCRGMLAYKLSGTFLAEYYLPLINIEEFVSHFKENLSSSSVKKVKKQNSRNK